MTPPQSRLAAVLAAALVLAALAAPASAGLYFEQTVESSGQGRGPDMRVRGWADGDRVRIDYLDSNHGIVARGSYLLTRDGGANVYLIDPEKKTWSRWEMAAVFSMLGQIEESTGGMMTIDFREPLAERLGTDDGGALLGHATTRHRWRTGYTMDMKLAFIDRSDRVETVSEAWVAPSIRDPALSIWFNATPPTTGDPELDEILLAQTRHLDGMVLKLVQDTTTTDKKGSRSSQRIVMEVTTLRRETPDASVFAMPVGYTETPLVPDLEAARAAGRGDGPETGASEGGGGLSALKGLLGRRKKDDR